MINNFLKLINTTFLVATMVFLVSCSNGSKYDGSFPLNEEGAPLSDRMMVNEEIYELGDFKKINITIDQDYSEGLKIALAEGSSIMHWEYVPSKIELTDYHEITTTELFSNGGSSILQEFSFDTLPDQEFQLIFKWVGKEGYESTGFEKQLDLYFK